jgi:transposase
MRHDGHNRVLPPLEGRCPRAPLNERQLRSLRLAFASGVTISDLIKRFGVSLRTVRSVLKAEVPTAEESGAADQKQ